MSELTTPTDRLGAALPATLRRARQAHGWSVATLAERSGVSRAMIGKIERGEVQPTAALLGRLSGALGTTLSELIADAESASGPDGVPRLSRGAGRPVWTDPETGYRRYALSPRTGGPLQLVEVELPPGARVDYPPEVYTFIHQQLWVLAGTLTFVEGDGRHVLAAGDCLELGEPAACTFRNDTETACRYLVALCRR